MKDRRLLMFPTNRFNFIYKTTNLVNGKIYIGCHTTDNMNDGYLGSGEYIRKAIKKYGRENFKREVLKFFYHPIAMYHEESIIVDEKFIKSKMNYNKSLGGNGGHFLGAKFIEDHRQRMMGAGNPIYGVGHSEETRKKMSELMQGEKHHLWGKKLPKEWVENAKRKREEARLKALKNNPLYADEIVDFILTKKEENVSYEDIGVLLANEFNILTKKNSVISHTSLKRLIERTSVHGYGERKLRAASILEKLNDPKEKYQKIECNECGRIISRNTFRKHICISKEAA